MCPQWFDTACEDSTKETASKRKDKYFPPAASFPQQRYVDGVNNKRGAQS